MNDFRGMTLGHEISAAVDDVLDISEFNANTLGRFDAVNQPLMTLVAANVYANITEMPDIPQATVTMIAGAAKEELCGLIGEGPHTALAARFFDQVDLMEVSRAEERAATDPIYELMKRSTLGALTFLTAVESWSPHAMPRIQERMRILGATNFEYITIHEEADHIEYGHGVALLEALEDLKPTDDEVRRGLTAFNNLFSWIFTYPLIEAVD